MSACYICKKEINGIVHCHGKEICYECCKKCMHHNDEISVLKCHEMQFYNKLLLSGLNISKEGRVYMGNTVVVIPPHKEAYITKTKDLSSTWELISKKVSGSFAEIDCRTNNDNIKMIVARDIKNRSMNKKAMSFCNETVHGTAIVILTAFGNYTGLKEKTAKIIMNSINEFNADETAAEEIYDVGA